jgi:hypothetical protein
MEVHFRNSYLEKLYEGLPVSGKARYSDEVIEKFREKSVCDFSTREHRRIAEF